MLIAILNMPTFSKRSPIQAKIDSFIQRDGDIEIIPEVINRFRHNITNEKITMHFVYWPCTLINVYVNKDFAIGVSMDI